MEIYRFRVLEPRSLKSVKAPTGWFSLWPLPLTCSWLSSCPSGQVCVQIPFLIRTQVILGEGPLWWTPFNLITTAEYLYFVSIETTQVVYLSSSEMILLPPRLALPKSRDPGIHSHSAFWSSSFGFYHFRAWQPNFQLLEPAYYWDLSWITCAWGRQEVRGNYYLRAVLNQWITGVSV